MKKHSPIVILFFLQTIKVYSQINSVRLEGKWTVCVTLTFSKDFNCQKGYVTYEFFSNGTFKDQRPINDGGGDRLFSSGKWSLKNDSLTIDYDDSQSSKSPPRTYKIILLSNTIFYEVGEEGKGVAVYTYFQKVD